MKFEKVFAKNGLKGIFISLVLVSSQISAIFDVDKTVYVQIHRKINQTYSSKNSIDGQLFDWIERKTSSSGLAPVELDFLKNIVDRVSFLGRRLLEKSSQKEICKVVKTALVYASLDLSDQVKKLEYEIQGLSRSKELGADSDPSKGRSIQNSFGMMIASFKMKENLIRQKQMEIQELLSFYQEIEDGQEKNSFLLGHYYKTAEILTSVKSKHPNFVQAIGQLEDVFDFIKNLESLRSTCGYKAMQLYRKSHIYKNLSRLQWFRIKGLEPLLLNKAFSKFIEGPVQAVVKKTMTSAGSKMLKSDPGSVTGMMLAAAPDFIFNQYGYLEQRKKQIKAVESDLHKLRNKWALFIDDQRKVSLKKDLVANKEIMADKFLSILKELAVAIDTLGGSDPSPLLMCERFIDEVSLSKSFSSAQVYQINLLLKDLVTFTKEKELENNAAKMEYSLMLFGVSFMGTVMVVGLSLGAYVVGRYLVNLARGKKGETDAVDCQFDDDDQTKERKDLYKLSGISPVGYPLLFGGELVAKKLIPKFIDDFEPGKSHPYNSVARAVSVAAWASQFASLLPSIERLKDVFKPISDPFQKTILATDSTIGIGRALLRFSNPPKNINGWVMRNLPNDQLRNIFQAKHALEKRTILDYGTNLGANAALMAFFGTVYNVPRKKLASMIAVQSFFSSIDRTIVRQSDLNPEAISTVVLTSVQAILDMARYLAFKRIQNGKFTEDDFLSGFSNLAEQQMGPFSQILTN